MLSHQQSWSLSPRRQIQSRAVVHGSIAAVQLTTVASRMMYAINSTNGASPAVITDRMSSYSIGRASGLEPGAVYTGMRTTAAT